MPLNQTEHGDVSWWKLSEGWPETHEHAYAKWVFANQTGVIPYGTYVLMGGPPHGTRGTLRVESQNLLDRLNGKFKIVYGAITLDRDNG